VYSQVGTPSAKFGGWGIGGVLGITPFY